MAITYCGSGICSYRRRTRLAIFIVTVPATIIRSACRGVARKAPAPKRSRSKRLAPTAIISMAQQARPKVMGQREFLRAQLMAKSRLVTMRPSSKRFSIQDMGRPPFEFFIIAEEGGGLKRARKKREEKVKREDVK